MRYSFSDRISSLQPSAIREILKVTQLPGVISFSAGNPAPETFPKDELAEISSEIFKNEFAAALQYGISEGFGPLRELMKSRLSGKYGIGREYDDLIIVSGGQQGMDLACKVLLNEGDTLICENPSFIGSLNAFRSYSLNLVGVPVDADGMDMDALESALSAHPETKLIYTIPAFQNPTGAYMSLERRHKILELAQKFDVIILEDSPYFELQYSGEMLPTLKSLDTEGRVIYVGSFSKIVSPGIRVGLACAHRDIISKMTVAKQVSDVHSNLFFQMAIARFFERYDVDAHIAKCRDIYRKKRDAMTDAIGRHFGGLADFTPPSGGLFLWCDLPAGYDAAEFCSLCSRRKVVGVPGSAFLVDEREISGGFRLNFSLPSFGQIEEGITIMGECLKEFIGAGR